MSVFDIALTIFFTFNALGNIPLFISLLRKYSFKKRLKITLRESSVALLLMLLFCFFGAEVLSGLGISLLEVRIGGGIILFLIALSMIFPREEAPGSVSEDNEPFIVPLAIPILTGPGTISTIMVYTGQESVGKVLPAIFLAWIPSMLALMFSSYLQRVLGEKILLMMERLMGFVLMLIAVQMFGVGILKFTEILKALV